MRAPVRLNRRTKIFPLLVLKNQFQFAIAAHIDNVPKQAKKIEMIYLLIIIIELSNVRIAILYLLFGLTVKGLFKLFAGYASTSVFIFGDNDIGTVSG